MLYRFLMSYCSTPNADVPNSASPAEVFLGRNMRIQLDVVYLTVVPTIPNDKMTAL